MTGPRITGTTASTHMHYFGERSEPQRMRSEHAGRTLFDNARRRSKTLPRHE